MYACECARVSARLCMCACVRACLRVPACVHADECTQREWDVLYGCQLSIDIGY